MTRRIREVRQAATPSAANMCEGERRHDARQSGLYSGFDPESGTWSSPASVTEAHYARPRVLAGNYISETQRQLDEFGVSVRLRSDGIWVVISGMSICAGRTLAVASA
jgi:hypothetical protein